MNAGTKIALSLLLLGGLYYLGVWLFVRHSGRRVQRERERVYGDQLKHCEECNSVQWHHPKDGCLTCRFIERAW